MRTVAKVLIWSILAIMPGGFLIGAAWYGWHHRQQKVARLPIVVHLTDEKTDRDCPTVKLVYLTDQELTKKDPEEVYNA